KAEPPRPVTRSLSEAPRAASPQLEPIPPAGPTGGFSSPPPAQRAEAPRSEPARSEAPRPAQARESTGSGEKSEGDEKRPRRRRSRRGGGRGGERELREGGAPPRRMAETIDNSDGKEFWEAWVDSKSDAPAAEGAAPSETAGAPREGREPREAREPREGRDRPRREREEAPLPEGHVRLYLNLGRRDGAKEPEIEQLLKDKELEVQSLELRNSHTYLIVPEDRADAVAAAHTGGKFGERDVLCERARK
ncbi:MAG: hypothetical protein ACXVDD_18035, partial [Polyangia bacterium]